MKHKITLAAVVAGALVSIQAPDAHAHFELGDPNPGGIGYRGVVAIHNFNSILSDTAHVGAWSWQEDSFAPNTGWTHTSNWYAIDLEVSGTFTLTIERQENVPWGTTSEPDRVASINNMYPSFTLFSGWDNDDTASHQFTNNGNISWAEDLTYIGHQENSSATSVTASFNLPAGQYTLVIGSNGPTNAPERQGYKATFQAQAVPEPSTALMAAVGGAAFLVRRRRTCC